ncbi:ribosomal RNA-processing protein 7-domain-containing protein [Elsinoe ampelina]|uniref:Ribosomal RNA-processing protein 7-domain-containing protein n=1 Tax=Elsinoe ampelina TaxID=302913 RepID=A0A6A6G071_9PEZI|nr:ribosomal RNA-processing protein 7-domain-containing protein [Elsinoe ampelina]
MTPSRAPSSINDYSILQLTLPPLPSLPKPQTHYLYVRPHAPKDSTASPTSLFLVNVPIDSTPTLIRALFASLSPSRISSIIFDSTPAPATSTKTSRKRKRPSAGDDLDTTFPWPATWDRLLQPSGATCVVTFVDAASATAAMTAARKAAKARTPLTWLSPDLSAKLPSLGLARYKAHHRLQFPDQAELQRSVDEYMSAYNEAEEAKKREEKKRRQVPDADGFVTVTRGGRSGVANEEEAKKGLEKSKKRMEGLEGFYRWQVREKRRDEERGLKRGFEEERRRVQGMRERRQGR